MGREHQGDARRPIVLGHDAAGMSEFLVLHRAATAMPGEVAQATLIGFPPGMTARSNVRVVVGVLALIAVFVVLRDSLALALGVSVMGSVALATILGRVRPAPHDRLYGVVVTSHRTFVAAGRRRSGPEVVAEHPASMLTWGRVESVEARRTRGFVISTLTLGGPSGAVVALEFPRFKREALEVILDQTDLTHDRTASTA